MKIKQKNRIKNCALLLLFSLFGSLLRPGIIDAICNKHRPTFTNSYGFYWGTATMNEGGSVQLGDEIRAYIDTVEGKTKCVGFSKVTKSGYYGSMAVYVNDPTTSEKDGIEIGDRIYFSICHNEKEYQCNEMSIWESSYVNNQIELNLTGSTMLMEVNEELDEEAKEFSEHDALCALQTFLEICPTLCGKCDMIGCDVNKDNRCTPADALCIYRKSKGIASCLDK